MREWAYNQAAATDHRRRLPRASERFSLTPEAVAVLTEPDHEACGMGMFHPPPAHDGDAAAAARELPHRTRPRLRQPRPGCGAVGLERGFEPWNRAHLVPTVLPTLDGVLPKLEEGGPGRRHRVRRRRRRPAARRGVPVEHVRRLRHLPARLGAGAIAPRRRRAGQRLVPRPTPRAAAGRPLRRPRHDVRLHPRHDRAAGDDGGDPRRARRRRHVVARRHQGARHVRGERPAQPDGAR